MTSMDWMDSKAGRDLIHGGGCRCVLSWAAGKETGVDRSTPEPVSDIEFEYLIRLRAVRWWRMILVDLLDQCLVSMSAFQALMCGQGSWKHLKHHWSLPIADGDRTKQLRSNRSPRRHQGRLVEATGVRRNFKYQNSPQMKQKPLQINIHPIAGNKKNSVYLSFLFRGLQRWCWWCKQSLCMLKL